MIVSLLSIFMVDTVFLKNKNFVAESLQGCAGYTAFSSCCADLWQFESSCMYLPCFLYFPVKMHIQNLSFEYLIF